MFNNLDVWWIDLNFTNLVKWKDMNHKYLWKIETNIITTKLDWKEIDITFANSATNNPNLVWVENIEFTNSKINSYWFSSETINAWLLTTKPIEYYSQMPKWVRLQSLNREVELVSYDDYVDIRDIIQWNPLIQAYKSIEI